MDKHICKFCGKEYENGKKLGGHISSCKQNPNLISKIKKIQNTVKNKKHIYTLKCEICGNEYKLELTENMFNKRKFKKTCSDNCAKKLTAMHTNSAIKNEKIKQSIISYNQTLNKTHNDGQLVDKRYLLSKTNNCICEVCGNNYFYKKYNPYNTFNSAKYCCKDCLIIGKHKKLSDLAKQNGLGGYHPNSIKKHHKGIYKDIRCDSSWELAFLVYYKEHNLYIERCTERRTYISTDNKLHNYFPDFVTQEGIIEIKGLKTEIVELKHKYNPDIKILYKHDIQHCLDYVTNKYGKEFWNILYEKNTGN